MLSALESTADESVGAGNCGLRVSTPILKLFQPSLSICARLPRRTDINLAYCDLQVRIMGGVEAKSPSAYQGSGCGVEYGGIVHEVL